MFFYDHTRKSIRRSMEGWIRDWHRSRVDETSKIMDVPTCSL